MSVATFQSAVFNVAGFGIQGELYTDYAHKAESFILNSASAAYNIIGATAYTVLSQGVAKAGSSGTLGYAGILSNPKQQALIGDGTNPLNPSLTLPNAVNADLVTQGTMVVKLPADCTIGDLVVFDNTTGALSTISPGADLPVGKTFAQAYVDYFVPNAGAAQLAVITLIPTLITPVLA